MKLTDSANSGVYDSIRKNAVYQRDKYRDRFLSTLNKRDFADDSEEIDFMRKVLSDWGEEQFTKVMHGAGSSITNDKVRSRYDNFVKQVLRLGPLTGD